MNQTELLKRGLDELHIDYTNEEITKIMLYKRLLEEKNKVMNLTAITDESHIIVKHFLDSLSVCLNLDIKSGMNILDVGTGGGFPGIPLAIFYKNASFTLLDSVNKKLTFVAETAKECGIDNIQVLHGRCEDLGHMSMHREAYDIVVSRAVAPMPVLIEITVPFAKAGGFIYAMKGPEAQAELLSCKEKLKIMGAQVVKIADLEVPFGDFRRTLVVIKKEKGTPKRYPRKPKEIEKDKIL